MKLPKKQIEAEIIEISAALEGEETKYDVLQIRDAYSILASLSFLDKDINFALDIFKALDIHIIEFLPEQIVKYFKWLEENNKTELL